MMDAGTGTVAAAGELRARRFTLVGEHGNVRAALGAASDGSLGLRLYDDGECRGPSSPSIRAARPT